MFVCNSSFQKMTPDKNSGTEKHAQYTLLRDGLKDYKHRRVRLFQEIFPSYEYIKKFLMSILTVVRRSGLDLGSRVLVGVVIGSVLGVVFGERITVVQPVGDIFIRLLVLTAIPLAFFNLLAGLTALSDGRTFGRLAKKIIGYYVLTDLVAVSLGLSAMVLFQPGVEMELAEQVKEEVGTVPSVVDVFVGMISTNVFQAFTEGNVM